MGLLYEDTLKQFIEMTESVGGHVIEAKEGESLDELVKKAMSNGMKYLFDRPALYTTALKFAPLANLIPKCCTHFSNWNAWGIGHAMPEFAKKSFHQLWKEGKVK